MKRGLTPYCFTRGYFDFCPQLKYDLIILKGGVYMDTEKAQRITITLPPDMLASIKKEVSSGTYGSTSELIREAMRLWQKREEEHRVRISVIRQRLAHSAQNGEPVSLDKAFKSIGQLHEQRMNKKNDENI